MDAARMSTSPIVQHMVAVKEGDHVENQEPEIVVADHVQPVPLALEVGAPSANEGRQGPLAAAIKCDSYEVFQSSLLTTTYCTASISSSSSKQNFRVWLHPHQNKKTLLLRSIVSSVAMNTSAEAAFEWVGTPLFQFVGAPRSI